MTTLHGLFTRDTRSVSEALSFTLLIGIVVLSVSVILLVGVSQLTEKQTTTEVEHAEQALVQFDSEASRVSSGSASTQETDLGLGISRELWMPRTTPDTSQSQKPITTTETRRRYSINLWVQ